MKVEVDRDKCISAGACVLSAPTVFDQDDDGIVVVLVDEPVNDSRQSVDEAELLCPARAITVSARG